MKVKVNENCIGCGACTAISDVFEINDNGTAEVVKEIDEKEEDDVRSAIENCPVEAIEEIKEEN